MSVVCGCGYSSEYSCDVFIINDIIDIVLSYVKDVYLLFFFFIPSWQ